jgi:hypothetical protein
MKLRAFAVACAASLSACSDGPVNPTAPSAAVSRAEPAATFPLHGLVQDAAFRPLPGAIVEVISGPLAGLTATADGSGEFRLTGAFTAGTLFRASKDGHLTRTKPWTCSLGGCSASTSARPSLIFQLDATTAPVNIAGQYQMTFIADSACLDLPAKLRTRTYRATVTQRSNPDRATGFTVTLSGAEFMGNLSRFEIGVAGDRLGLWLNGGHNAAIVELTDSFSVAISGNASASIDATHMIMASFDGWIEHSGGGDYSHCESANHRLTLIPDP